MNYLQKISLLLTAITILAFNFGMFTMDMDDNGNMSDCPFTDTVALCPMNFSEHILLFQSAFRAIPVKTTLYLLLITVSILTLFKISPRDYPSFTRFKLPLKDKPELPIFNKILFAISDGIIQPKLYA